MKKQAVLPFQGDPEDREAYLEPNPADGVGQGQTHEPAQESYVDPFDASEPVQDDGWEDVGDPQRVSMAEGDVLEGTYTGRRQIDVEGRPSTLHSLTTDSGDYEVWGSTLLDRFLLGLEGRYVRVTALGRSVIKGGHTLKLFRVQVRR